jgi:ABC-2 type transport system permease protein
MQLFKLIFNSECRILLRSSIFIFSMLFFLILSGYAIYYGHSIIETQNITIEKVSIDNEDRFQKLKSSIDRDTLPNIVGNRLFRIVTNPPTTLAAFTIGQRDILPFYGTIRYWALSRQSLVTESVNPEKLVAGNLDLAFVFIQILPLLIIGLGYNLISSERETGTLSMVLSFPITIQQILLYKLVTRFIIILTAVILIIIAGCIYSNIVFNADLLNWSAVVVVYILFWFCVLYFLNTLGKSSSFNALTSLGVWLLLVFLIPAAINIYVGIRYPMSSKQELSQTIRHEYEGIWKKYEDPNYRNEVAIAFGNKYPEYKSDTSYNWSDKYMLAQYDNYDQKLKPLLEKYQDEALKREKLTAAIGRFNPVVSAQLLMNHIAQTDVTAHIDFIKRINAFHAELKSFFYKMVFTNTSFRVVQFDEIPDYGK